VLLFLHNVYYGYLRHCTW